MTKEQFDNLYLNKVVHCPTEELAIEFLELAKEFGYGIEGINYDVHKEKTCFNIEIEDDEVYNCTLDWYKKKGYEIVEFNPLKVNSLLTDEERELLKPFNFGYLQKANNNLYIFDKDDNEIGYIGLSNLSFKFSGLEDIKEYTPKELGL